MSERGEPYPDFRFDVTRLGSWAKMRVTHLPTGLWAEAEGERLSRKQLREACLRELLPMVDGPEPPMSAEDLEATEWYATDTTKKP